jgi:hypothetical protein
MLHPGGGTVDGDHHGDDTTHRDLSSSVYGTTDDARLKVTEDPAREFGLHDKVRSRRVPPQTCRPKYSFFSASCYLPPRLHRKSPLA